MKTIDIVSLGGILSYNWLKGTLWYQNLVLGVSFSYSCFSMINIGSYIKKRKISPKNEFFYIKFTFCTNF